MQKENVYLTQKWAQTIIQELLHHNVAHFCIAPGSRSTPLTYAIANNKNCEHTVHFDERSLGFYALGIAKALKKPVAVIVTSGTAVGNLLPALMEAYESSTQLILLTADRPAELQLCGANQTTDQINMFSNFVKISRSFQAIDPFTPIKALQSQLSFALHLANQNPRGSLHLNLMFREPFLDDSQHEFQLSPIRQYYCSEKNLSPIAYDELSEILSLSKNVLIACGWDTGCRKTFEAIAKLSENLNAPIFCDILSNHLAGEKHQNYITHGSLLFKTELDKERYNPDLVIHFGGRFVSKQLYRFLEKSKSKYYIHVNEHTKLEDPSHITTHFVNESPLLFCQNLTNANEKKNNIDDKYVTHWKEANNLTKHKVVSYLENNQLLSEPWLFHTLSNLDLSGFNLFLANSMPIRDAHDYFHPNSRINYIFGNRGVSGIDGNLSTIIGITKASMKKTLAVVGDLTFLHDLTALALLNESISPIVFIVINNNGGCIFRSLPIYQKKHVYEKFFETPHNLSFEGVKDLFHISHANAIDQKSVLSALSNALKSKKHSIIEIKVSGENGTVIRKEVLEQLRETETVLC